MRIIDLQPQHVNGAATVLFKSFGTDDAWPDLASAVEEVEESLAEGRISRLALDDEGEVLGWIGGISQYDGRVWELHPLAVSPNHRELGIGRALVADFEQQVRDRGGSTITLGTDDLEGKTSLSGIDLYPDVWTHIASIKNLRRHPYEFYQKLGYVIVGVVPDANGPGRPDIMMAKKVSA